MSYEWDLHYGPRYLYRSAWITYAHHMKNLLRDALVNDCDISNNYSTSAEKKFLNVLGDMKVQPATTTKIFELS